MTRRHIFWAGVVPVDAGSGGGHPTWLHHATASPRPGLRGDARLTMAVMLRA